MAELNGFIKIHRKLVQWGWYQDNVVKGVFLHLLLTARFYDGKWMGRTIKAGQVVIGTNQMAKELGFSRQQIRTAINKLKSTNEITTETTNKYTIVTLVNWEEYQTTEEKTTTTSTNTLTNEQPTNNQQITNNQPQLKNDKNDKNDKNEYIYGEFKNVLLTADEFEKLKSSFSDYQDRIEKLSSYIASKGKKYKSHYATILNWARKDGNNGNEQLNTGDRDSEWGINTINL